MIFLYSDVLYKAGGIETYLHALARKLLEEGIPFRVAVSEQEQACPLIDELVSLGVDVHRQRLVPGDRWHLRKRMLVLWLWSKLRAGDWVYCVRQPMPEIYLWLVRLVHSRKARIAASWIFAPSAMKIPARLQRRFSEAVRETDAVISVAKCTAGEFSAAYGYTGPVHVVRYHNLPVFEAPVPLPPAPPFRIGFLGRIEIVHKNLDMVLAGFEELCRRRGDVELHFFGGGPDEPELERMVRSSGLGAKVMMHGRYDHRTDLPRIMASCHLFIYPSRYEGGPCLSLLELLQAGRFVVTTPVGGIPDIYEGHAGFGIMVAPDDVKAFVDALESALKKVAANAVDQTAMRDHYARNFDMHAAHEGWMKALDLRAEHRP
jgi:glycosyltransferase involved in cell wall biosynthesis